MKYAYPQDIVLSDKTTVYLKWELDTAVLRFLGTFVSFRLPRSHILKCVIRGSVQASAQNPAKCDSMVTILAQRPRAQWSPLAIK